MIPLLNIVLWNHVGYARTGDQDFEEFHFSFSHDSQDYLLNCSLFSSESVSSHSDNVYYRVSPSECVLIHEKGGSQDVNIDSFSIQVDERF